MSHAEGWPEGLTRDAAVAAARETRRRDEMIRSGSFAIGDDRLADAVLAAQMAAMHGDEVPAAPTPAPAPVRQDAEAEDFRAEHGYPIDAKRLPAGSYELTGTDAWNQEDPTHPDGVRLRRRGDHLSLTEHEASRLLFIGAISDPDVVRVDKAAEHTGALGEAVTVRDSMVEQLESFRERHRDKLMRNAGERDRLRKVLTDVKRRMADLDVEDEQARVVVTSSDDDLAARLGGTFASTFATLNESIALLQETPA